MSESADQEWLEKNKNRESFKKRASSAAFWEAWVGSSLSRLGLYTVHHPFKVEEWDKVHEFSQSWDLDVASGWPDVPATYWARLPVEVKARNISFGSESEYSETDKGFVGMDPEQVFVCSQSSYCRKWPGKKHLPRDFLIVSKVTGHISWLPKGSPVHFGVDVNDETRREIFKAVVASKNSLLPLSEFVEYVLKET